jgi:hypothetical protein
MHAIVEIRNLSDQERQVVEAFLRHPVPVREKRGIALRDAVKVLRCTEVE